MRIVFFGASGLGYRCCEALLGSGADVVGIVTVPREFRISYSPEKPVTNVQFADMAELGRRHGVPVLTVTGRLRDHEEALRALRPDFFLVIGWYHMIPRAVREIAPRGCAGIHASLLPRYRGGAPLVWAMIEGERETGVTFFHFADGVDDGDVIARKPFPITGEDTIREVLARAEASALELVTKYVPRIADGTAPRIPQDHAQATVVPQRGPEDGAIDWRWDAPRVLRFIRAQTRPYPGAFTETPGGRVHVWEARLAETGPLPHPPGSLIPGSGAPVVACGRGSVALTSLTAADEPLAPDAARALLASTAARPTNKLRAPAGPGRTTGGEGT